MYKSRRWTVSHSKFESKVHLTEYNFKARLWSLALEVFETIDAIPPHWICSPPEWAFKIPLGKPRYYEDDDTFIENSLGGWWYDRISQFIIWVMDHEEASSTVIVELPINDETFAKVWPEMAFLVEDDDDE